MKMIDREKVIKGLEEAETMLTRAVDCGGEMSVMGAFKCLNRVTDALDLLKEQEAVKPDWSNGKAFCGKCGQPFPRHRGSLRRFCSYCGKAVKWE